MEYKRSTEAWGGREVASELGVCSVAAFYCWNVDGCRTVAVEKETESIVTNVSFLPPITFTILETHSNRES
ncbi:hypothetical protein JOQ06_024713, partial [Pogonophryne albipinna]